MKYVLSILLILFSVVLNAQAFDKFKSQNDSLRSYFTKLGMSKNDSDKVLLNSKILAAMRAIVADEVAFNYTFDSVPNLGKVKSKDDRIRFLNWNLAFDNGEFAYYGFLLVNKNGKKPYKFYELADKSKSIPEQDGVSLPCHNWLGALYYDIIDVKYFGRKQYVLLGWDGYNDITNRKIIDVLVFKRGDEPIFGQPVFFMKNNEIKRRVIFEYNERTSMTLKYDSEKNMIVFDHLSPVNENLDGMSQYKGPDFSYDALKYKKGRWHLVEDIEVKNPKTAKSDKLKPKNKRP